MTHQSGRGVAPATTLYVRVQHARHRAEHIPHRLAGPPVWSVRLSQAAQKPASKDRIGPLPQLQWSAALHAVSLALRAPARSRIRRVNPNAQRRRATVAGTRRFLRERGLAVTPPLVAMPRIARNPPPAAALGVTGKLASKWAVAGWTAGAERQGHARNAHAAQALPISSSAAGSDASIHLYWCKLCRPRFPT
eukprot:CAMPEP_0185543488 /NCGR_PEP_ID=MMETSP1381-20130426/3291_1 /TAXON_ID=298111 /ORGANISM="Pavlova sp., Strain CCMP459" /LENGTH=192 /DNA_ID=CAMNT_0028155589 /DNA_START=42 /DNA_END=623 /DNA_ORIENTATION=+